VEENGKQYVYKKKGDNYVLSQIETGFTNGAYTEVVSGIDEGESYYIASVVVNETSEEEADQEEDTQASTQTDGMDMNQQGGGMPSGMQNGGGGNMGPGMGGGGPR
jgi:hypothetical protein